MRWVRPSRLKTDPDLAGLFLIADTDLVAITESMRERGYDPAEPIVVWDAEAIIVDGHTRLEAARSAGLEQVAIDERGFEDKRAALEYAIRRQRDRRNLTREQLTAFTVRAIEALDRVKPAAFYGNQHAGVAPIGATPGKSAAETAEQVDLSARQVERVRTVLTSDNEEVKEQLRNGQVSINAAATAVKTAQEATHASAASVVILGLEPSGPELRSIYGVAEWEALTIEERALVVEFAPLTDMGQKATFNQVNENIDWAKWSWNPITGCLHNCPYCYARDIAERFFDQRFAPTFIPSRLQAPAQTKVPGRAVDEVGWRNVFVCSMADLFGKWVPQDWIEAVFEQVRINSQWNFLFLTKFPQRLAELEWPKNAWCGTSVDYQYRVAIAEKSFRDIGAGVKWLSCEPLLERLTFTSLEMFDWIVIGAASKSTQTPAFQPPWEWVEHLIAQARAAGCHIYIKPNLTSRPQEYPVGAIPRGGGGS